MPTAPSAHLDIGSWLPSTVAQLMVRYCSPKPQSMEQSPHADATYMGATGDGVVVADGVYDGDTVGDTVGDGVNVVVVDGDGV